MGKRVKLDDDIIFRQFNRTSYKSFFVTNDGSQCLSWGIFEALDRKEVCSCRKVGQTVWNPVFLRRKFEWADCGLWDNKFPSEWLGRNILNNVCVVH
jgi:hypothetical protein